MMHPSNSPVLRPSNSPELRPTRRSPFQASPKAASNVLERKRPWEGALPSDDELPPRKMSHALEDGAENRAEAALHQEPGFCLHGSAIDHVVPESRLV